MGEAEEVAFCYEKYVNPAVARLFRFLGLGASEARAEGIYVYDANGKRYLDCLGGYGVFSLGHRHPEVVEAVRRQLDQMPLSAKLFFSEPLARLSEALAGILPGDICYSFVVNSGAEAVEGALKLARLATGRSKIVAMENGFHGKTFGALSATGKALYRAPFEPLVPGFCHIPFNDSEAAEAAVDAQTAAVIVEPVQGEGGVVPAADGYLARLKAICQARGALLVCDEVQTGLGRTGRMFACEHALVAPDIVATGKALGGGVMPIGAFSANAAVWQRFSESPFLHTSTFGGNPLACAAALAAIRVLRRDYARFAVADKGAYFLAGLEELAQRHPRLIGSVRGRGLMLGISFADEGVAGLFIAECLRAGILAAYALNRPKVVRLEPPFLIERADIAWVLDHFTDILHRAEHAC